MDRAVEATDGPLGRFQQAFAAALLSTEIDANGTDAGEHGEIAALARQPGFAVYRNTVLKGCVDALQANYPAVARLVGDEWFRAAAAAFARANLPTQPMLLDYGAGFADFLATFPPAAELSYLPDVARLDRLWTEAHTARDEAPLGPESLAALAPDELARAILRPHAAARWAWFGGEPIYTIWQRNRAEGPLDDSPIEWHGEGALVARPHDAVRWCALDRAGCAFLDACASGRTLAEAGTAALAGAPDANLAALGEQLFAAGAFGSLDIARP